MTFEQWVKERDFWKSDTHTSFKPLWDRLIASGEKPDVVAELLNAAVSAMDGEYGAG